MPESLVRLLEAMPFFIAGGVGGRSPQVNRTRILEAVLIAAITAGATAVVGAKVGGAVIEERSKAQQASIAAVTNEVRELRDVIVENKVKLGDRWTATDEAKWQATHGREHADLATRLEVHKVRGHPPHNGGHQ